MATAAIVDGALRATAPSRHRTTLPQRHAAARRGSRSAQPLPQRHAAAAAAATGRRWCAGHVSEAAQE
ncbi:hypothetical protein [Tepidimonas charontis]|uniref:hypothetical protein n=1 Tax=Tepidimonas charontis TaxID=2267262 RepID=UPI001185D967|nr:hypothetical protein [Tepidimonas charontis]